jgi:hypothetical protein
VRVVARDARIGAEEDVVHDRDVVGVAGQVELGAAALVHTEPVRLDAEAVAGEELDQILVPAAAAADVARQGAVEPVPANHQARAEAAMDEVTAEAVVEPIVLDGDVVGEAPEEEAVRPGDRAVAAVREDAPADDDVTRVRHDHSGHVRRPLRRDEQVVEVDVRRGVDLDGGVLRARRDRQRADRDVLRPLEEQPLDVHAPRADDAQERRRAGRDDELPVRAWREDDRPAGEAARRDRGGELRLARHVGRRVGGEGGRGDESRERAQRGASWGRTSSKRAPAGRPGW